MKLNLNIMNIQGAIAVHGQRLSRSILAPIFGRLCNPFLRVGRALAFDRARDGSDDHSSPIGMDEEHPAHFNPSFRWRPAFDRGADSLDLHASERPVGVNAFRKKDWHKG